MRFVEKLPLPVSEISNPAGAVTVMESSRLEPLAVKACAAEAVPFVEEKGFKTPLTSIVGNPGGAGAAVQGLSVMTTALTPTGFIWTLVEVLPLSSYAYP